MDSDEPPKNINIGGSVDNGIVINGSHNVINAPKPVNDKGIFMPTVRNALFTGREDALTALAAALSDDKNVVITHSTSSGQAQAITGMGGLGKSQLALEFAYRSADKFVSAHWLNLMDPSQLNSEIAKCGRDMGLLDDSAKQPDMVAATLRVWASHGPRLLVLDNYESTADAMQTLAPLLALPTLRLLITARRAEFPPELGLHPYPLDVFTPSESVEFIRKLVKLKDSETPNIEKLAETLGHLPLALHLAGHYLREEGITPAQYLTELDEVLAHESMQAAWFAQMDIQSPTQHEQSLLGTFALSWQKVTDPTAQTIFKLAGYLAPNEPIPLEIFAAVLEVDEKDRGLRKALRLLVEKVGLFTMKDGLPVIHPLLGAYGRYLDGESSELLERLAGKLTGLAQRANEQVDQSGSLSWFAPLQAHIQATAKHAEKENLQYAAFLYNNLGYHLQKLANYAAAHDSYERAIKIGEARFGKDHPEVATYVNNLGSVLHDMGDLSGACTTIERALNINETVFGKEHPTVSNNVNNLGGVFQDMGDLSSAYAAYERALKIDETTFGTMASEVAVDLNNLGSVLQDLGNLKDARIAFERAIEIWETNLGKNHMQVVKGINNLAGVMQASGDLVGARDTIKHAIRILETNLNENHPTVGFAINNLGVISLHLGDLVDARNALERAIGILEASLGKDHHLVATAINNLGEVLSGLGDLAGAKAAFNRAIWLGEINLGKNHPKIGLRINNLGLVLDKLGNLNGARYAFERAIYILENNFVNSHPDIATVYINLGTVLQAQGQKKRARDCYRSALTIYEQFLPSGHFHIWNARGFLVVAEANLLMSSAIMYLIEKIKKWLKSLINLP